MLVLVDLHLMNSLSGAHEVIIYDVICISLWSDIAWARKEKSKSIPFQSRASSPCLLKAASV